MTLKEYNHAIDLYADNLFRFALRLSKNEDLAKDLVQDTFEKVWKKVDDISFSKIKSYLFKTIYTAFIDYRRREKLKDKIEVESNIAYNEYSDLNDILHAALNTLPEILRTVILLRDYEGYSYQEIGDITNLNESQVKVYIYRARKKLQTYIGKMEYVI